MKAETAIRARRYAVWVLLGSVSPVAMAWGQSATPEEIVVTASKRSESLQKAPLSIVALTGRQLAQHQVSSFDDYAKLLPSVSYQSFGPGQSQLNFRGISTGGDGIVTGPLPSAGTYVDETPLTTIANTPDLHIYDMERIEALAGPQGTLYGASSLSGTLRLITNKPVIGEFHAGLSLEANKFGPGGAGGTAQGFVNIPLNEKMALRVVAYEEHDGGYINNTPTNRTYQRWYDNDAGDLVAAPLTVNNDKYAKKDFNPVDSAGGRAALKVDLNEYWTATPTVIYQHQLAQGSFLEDPKAGDLDVHDFGRDHNLDNWTLASMTLQGKISDWDLTYAGSYFGRRVDNTSDYSYFTVAYDQLAGDPSAGLAGYTNFVDSLGNPIDPTQLVHEREDYTKTSQELRISSPNDARAKITAGLFAQRQTEHFIADYEIAGLANATDASSLLINGAPNDDIFYSNLDRIDRDYAAYAQGSYDITKSVTLVAGVRGFAARNSLRGFSGGQSTLLSDIAALGCSADATVEACPNTNKTVFDTGETHKAGINWQIDRDHMVYFTYSTGFRPGGANRKVSFNGEVQDVPNFAPDTLTNYEVGWKTSWLNHSLYLNGALFWEDWSKIQYSEPGLLGVYFTVNAGDARSQGVELNASWKIAHKLTLAANTSFADPRLTSSFCSTSGCNPNNGGQVYAAAGTPLPVTPKFKLNGTVRYDFDFPNFDSYVQAGINHQSGTRSFLRDDYEAIIGPTAGFTTFDFSAGWSKNAWSITAYINNAFDSRGVLSKNEACVPSVCGAYIRDYVTKPQLFGLRSSYEF